MLFFKDFVAQEGRQDYPCKNLFVSEGLMDSDSNSTLSIVIIGLLVISALIAFVTAQRDTKNPANKSVHLSFNNTASGTTASRTYDEDDSKGYPIRRSTRTRTSPSRYIN